MLCCLHETRGPPACEPQAGRFPRFPARHIVIAHAKQMSPTTPTRDHREKPNLSAAACSSCSVILAVRARAALAQPRRLPRHGHPRRRPRPKRPRCRSRRACSSLDRGSCYKYSSNRTTRVYFNIVFAVVATPPV